MTAIKSRYIIGFIVLTASVAITSVVVVAVPYYRESTSEKTVTAMVNEAAEGWVASRSPCCSPSSDSFMRMIEALSTAGKNRASKQGAKSAILRLLRSDDSERRSVALLATRHEIFTVEESWLAVCEVLDVERQVALWSIMDRCECFEPHIRSAFEGFTPSLQESLLSILYYNSEVDLNYYASAAINSDHLPLRLSGIRCARTIRASEVELDFGPLRDPASKGSVSRKELLALAVTCSCREQNLGTVIALVDKHPEISADDIICEFTHVARNPDIRVPDEMFKELIQVGHLGKNPEWNELHLIHAMVFDVEARVAALRRFASSKDEVVETLAASYFP